MVLNIEFLIFGTAYVGLSAGRGVADVTYTIVCGIHLRLRHCSAKRYTVKTFPAMKNVLLKWTTKKW